MILENTKALMLNNKKRLIKIKGSFPPGWAVGSPKHMISFGDLKGKDPFTSLLKVLRTDERDEPSPRSTLCVVIAGGLLWF